MTPEQWAEIVEWVGDRFPNNPWQADQAVAYFYDLEIFDTSDVWSGLHYLYEKGQAFAPTGSQLLHATRKVRRKAAYTERYQPKALPEPAGAVWSEWAKETFGIDETAIEMIERLHRESVTCKSSSCPYHAKVTT